MFWICSSLTDSNFVVSFVPNSKIENDVLVDGIEQWLVVRGRFVHQVLTHAQQIDIDELTRYALQQKAEKRNAPVAFEAVLHDVAIVNKIAYEVEDHGHHVVLKFRVFRFFNILYYF